MGLMLFQPRKANDGQQSASTQERDGRTDCPSQHQKEVHCPATGLPGFIALCLLALHRCCDSYKLRATPPTRWLALLQYSLRYSHLEPNPRLWGLSVDLGKCANLDFGLLASRIVWRYLNHPVCGSWLWQSRQTNARVLTRIVVMRQRDCCLVWF